MSPQLGVVLPTRTYPAPLPLPELLRIAADVDANPAFGQLWVPDSILALPYYDSTVLLAAAAATTGRVQLGVACLASLGFRHPVIVAKEWANLDALSGGRMIFVGCPGNATGAAVEKELGVFGLSYPEKLERFEEYVDFLRQASAADGAFDYHGKHVTVSDLTLRPAFVQRPLPIWLAANPSPAAGPKTIDRVLGRVARLGAGWMTYNVQPDALRERNVRLTELRAALGDHGTDFPTAVFLNTNVNPDEKAAFEDAAAKWAQQSTRNVSTEDLQRIGAIGDPSRAAEFIARLTDAGATHIVLELLSTNPRRQLELISEHLIPRLLARRRGPACWPVTSRRLRRPAAHAGGTARDGGGTGGGTADSDPAVLVTSCGVNSEGALRCNREGATDDGDRPAPAAGNGRERIDLSHVVEGGMVTVPGLPAPVISDFLSREQSRTRYAAGTEFQIGTIELCGNTGTYLDTPFHRYPDGTDLAGLPLERLAELDGVVIDVSGRTGRAVDRDQLLRYEVRDKAVLVRTGWDRHWGTDAYFHGYPFLTAGAAEHLAVEGATLVGIDSLNIDDTGDGQRPAHSALLAAGIPVCENLTNLAALPVHGFRFSAVPVKVHGMGTFPVRAYATYSTGGGAR